MANRCRAKSRRSSRPRESLACGQGAARTRRLIGIGWTIKRQTGSHRIPQRAGSPDYVFAFHDGDEIGPQMLARIAKHPVLGHKIFKGRPAPAPATPITPEPEK